MISHPWAAILNADSTIPTRNFTGFPPSGHMRCPRCAYSLRGLPAEHACPECGFTYDADSRIWYIRPPRFVIVFLSLVVGIPFLVSTIRLTILTLADGRFPLGLSLFTLTFYGITAGLFVWIIRRGRRNPMLLGMNPAGMFARTQSGNFRLMPWQDIRDVSAQRMRLLAFHRIRIEFTNGRTARMGTPFTQNEANDFVEAARARLSPMEDGA